MFVRYDCFFSISLSTSVIFSQYLKRPILLIVVNLIYMTTQKHRI